MLTSLIIFPLPAERDHLLGQIQYGVFDQTSQQSLGQLLFGKFTHKVGDAIYLHGVVRTHMVLLRGMRGEVNVN